MLGIALSLLGLFFFFNFKLKFDENEYPYVDNKQIGKE